LNDKKIIPPDIFVELHERLAIGKRGHRGFSKGDFYEIGDPLGELSVGVTREDL
jgi:hypothetical protein